MMALGIGDLIDAHADVLYRYAYRLAGSTADAEDLVQDTFARAISRLAQLRDPDKARGWLFRILRNEYLRRIRGEKRIRVVPLDGTRELAESAAEESSLPPIDSATLQAALNDLDESFRTPLILFYFEEFSYKDIADQMDLPIGTVMSRLARGKVYLKDRLTRSLAAKGGGS
jgi:RNA polymerase sigma-70 factor, ECF subfamily